MIRAYFMRSIALDAVLPSLSRMSARDLANVMAGAYGALGLHHLDKAAR